MRATVVAYCDRNKIQPAAGGVAHSSASLNYDPGNSYATCVYIDGKVVQPSGVAFVNGNSAGGRDLHLRNVFVSGTTQLTQFGTNAAKKRISRINRRDSKH